MLRINSRHLRRISEATPDMTPEPPADKSTVEQPYTDNDNTSEGPPGEKGGKTTTYVTSSGRTVRKPRRLNDYV